MSYENLKVESVAKHVELITIQRATQLNALNKLTISELSRAFDDLEKDPNVRVIVITGDGEKAFVAGADIKEFSNFDPQQGKALAADGQKLLFDKIANLSKPVIAAINGFALGGGLELALASHIRFASNDARLGLPELTLGLIPGYGGTQRLMQLVGKGKALEWILTAKMFGAEEAEKYGLVQAVFSADVMLETAVNTAAQIAKQSPSAIKELLKATQIGSDISRGLKAEIDAFGSCFGTEDFKEGVTAFLEKRKPNF